MHLAVGFIIMKYAVKLIKMHADWRKIIIMISFTKVIVSGALALI